MMKKVSVTEAKTQLMGVSSLGWETGIEPATFGATDRRSTS